jgi:hypothetical protein
LQSECPTKKKNRERAQDNQSDDANVASESTDIALICSGMIDSALVCKKGDENSKLNNFWVGDRDASCHMICNDERLIDWKWADEEITVAGGTFLPVKKIGNLRTKFKNSKGENSAVLIENVKYIPSLKMNLFSLTLGMRMGWKIESFEELFTIKKHDQMITFHQKVPVGLSFLPCAEEIIEDHLMIVSPRKQYDFKSFHDLLGHASIEITRRTAVRLGIKLTGRISTCEDCLLAKIKRKIINKQGMGRSKIPGERLLVDISCIKRKSLGVKDTHTWLLIEDQATSMKWSFFLRKKGELIEHIINFIKMMKGRDPESIKFIRLYNAGENLGLKSRIGTEGLNVQLEFTSTETPEQNGQVERSFATLWSRVRSILNRSGVSQDLREKLWAECASTATKLSNLVSRENGRNPYLDLYGKRKQRNSKFETFW